jgi:hypothetical protein
VTASLEKGMGFEVLMIMPVCFSRRLSLPLAKSIRVHSTSRTPNVLPEVMMQIEIWYNNLYSHLPPEEYELACHSFASTRPASTFDQQEILVDDLIGSPVGDLLTP